MKREKAILSIIMVIIGLIFAGFGFYLFQMTKTIPEEKIKEAEIIQPTVALKNEDLLIISEPTEDALLNKKVIKISGSTKPDATVIIFTESDYDVLKPTNLGTFNTTINIDDGVNIIKITAISKNGEEKSIYRTVSYTTEEF